MNYKSFIFLTFFYSVLPVVAAPLASDVLQLRVDNPCLSPNHDGIQDSIFFTPILKAEWDVKRWRLDILSDKGKVVYRATGSGFTTLIQWNGTDRKNEALPEGTYRATLYAWGDDHHATSEAEPVMIDNTPPLVELAVSSGAERGAMKFHPRAQEANPLDRWLLQFVDLNGRTLHVAWSSGSVVDVNWPDMSAGDEPVQPGPYKAVFQAWDRAGNESAPVFADFTVAFSGNRSVRGSLKKIRAEESRTGLLIRLPSSEIFTMKYGKPALRPSATASLDEVALLVNAFPQAPVRLDGYSFAKASAASDRDLGSLYAWMVYSHLVKQGSTQASRVTVRGRGRILAEDRDKNVSAPLKNGIEVWLLGPGPW